MCKSKKCACSDCIVIIQKNPTTPPLPPNPLFPPNADTVQQVISRSCVYTCKRKKCECIVKQLYIAANELQAAFRRVDANWIASFYSETAFVSYNGQMYIGKSAILSGVIEPLITGYVSVNPDYTTLTYQVHNELLVTQYGTFTSTSTTSAGTTVTTTYNIVATWEYVCDKWLIANEILSVLVM